MASSGSVDFSVSRDDIIKGALRAARIIGKDQTPNSSEITNAAQALNMIVKQWQGKADFAPGLKEWSRKTGYVFLQPGQSEYALGPSGDHATSAYVTTTLSAAKAANATSVSVTSVTGMTIGDFVGVVLTSGAIGWSTISAIPGALTIPSNSLGTAPIGARVFAYTTKMRRPLEILTAVLRDTLGEDFPVVFMKREEYEALPVKGTDGTPTKLLYEPFLTNGRLTFNAEPDDATKVLRIVFWGSMEDFDALNDTPDYPQEWFRPLKYQLAIDSWPEYKEGDPPKILVTLRNESLLIAQNTNPDTTDLSFEPNR
jgi:hypothetical protein